MTADGSEQGPPAISAAVAVEGNGVASEVLAEMLEHQGIVYDRLDRSRGRRYPVVLSLAESGRATKEDIERLHGGVAILADEVIEVERVRRLLSGQDEGKSDTFGAFMNEQEELLLTKVKTVLAEQGVPLVQKWYWPRFAKAACVLTHDLDWFVYSPYHGAVLRSPGGVARQPRLLYKRVVSRTKFGWNVPETVSAESSAGFRSSVFIKTKYEKSEQILLGKTLEILKGSGADVGLHAARSSYRKEESLREEIREFQGTFGHPPKGIRQHMLKFEVPKTWQIQVSSGMEFDATFSFNEYFGFRAGTCLPYRPLVGRERLPITELPTSFMDWTFIHRKFGKEEIATSLKKLIATVERHHGLLVVNFHNTYLDRNLFPDVWDTYVNLLQYLKSENYWVATASECAAWWSMRSRNRPTLEERNDSAAARMNIPLLLHEGGESSRLPGVNTL